MEENRLFPGIFHYLGRYPVRGKFTDPFLPDGVRLSHGHPNVRVHHICALGPFLHVRGQGNASPGSFCVLPALGHQPFVRKILFRCTSDKIHTHVRTSHHQRIPHIVPGVPHINQFYAFQTAEVLPYRQHIRQNLGRMVFIGQAVPHRHPCIPGQLLHNLLPKPPVFDPVINPPQHPGRVRNTLLFADLGTGRV